MKRILPEYDFSEEQLNRIRFLAKDCGLCEDTVKILYGRGIQDKESIRKFLRPSKDHFISPFKMQGMTEAVGLITRARDEMWTVVVYGDYDADGICASTIMAKVLSDFGIEPFICVPERRDGYGLTVGLIDKIFEEYCPELIITVDCGISGAEEVKYIQEQGAEVIITDHHELPDTIPDCICINPKFNDGYEYDNLCGAGVAFKVGCALIGERAYKYLDFTAIATVADSVPLTGENRDIVAEGLKLINKNPSKCYSGFINTADGNINSQSLAFSIAPKINAAGRMGDANSALTLFNSFDDKEIFDLTAKLVSYNMERQKYCDELYLSAKAMLAERGETGKVIMLYNENWNTGFVGIVAARLAEEFSRPAILFVKNGDTLKGSARSVESINIYEALKACSGYISEFGGHSQAAGVNVNVDDFENLYKAINDYVTVHCSADDFIPTIYINGELKDACSPRFAKELELLEPFGVGNKRPVFMLEEGGAEVRRVKPFSPHISIKSNKLELMCFGGAKYSRLFESGATKKYVFEYNVSTFRGKEYVKGFVRDFVYGNDAVNSADGELKLGLIDAVANRADIQAEFIDSESADKLMAECNEFGTCFVVYNRKVLQKYKNAEKLNCELFALSGKNAVSVILFCPQEADLSGYNKVVFLDGILDSRIILPQNCNIISVKEDSALNALNSLNCDRQYLLKIFAVISANSGSIQGENAVDASIKNDLGYPREQVLFAIKVFEELSLLSFKKGKLEVFRGIKTKLENSALYNLVNGMQA